MDPFEYDYYYAGGIVGYNQDGSIDNCRNNGSVESKYSDYYTSYVGGVVGGTGFDDYSKYKNGNYVASVTNSINTSSKVVSSFSVKAAGVVGIIKSKSTENKSIVQNCYYDADVLKNTTAYKKLVKGKVTDVNDMRTVAMKTQDLTDVLNTMNGKRENAFAWYFESGDYPRLYFGVNHGVFHIVFKVDNEVYFESMTAKGVMENSVASPKSTNSRSFKGWLDSYNKLYTTDEANARVYDKNVEYNASFDNLYAVKFVTSYGKELSTSYFKKNDVPFYSETNIPANDTTAAIIYKFKKWDKDFVPVTEATTYTAMYEEIPVLVDITFVNYNDTVLKVVPTAVNSMPVFSENGEVPSKEADAQFTYEFTGWTPELVKATEAAKYTAVYKEIVNKYEVKFFVLGEQKGETQSIEYGKSAEAPEVAAVPGYRFDGWDKAFDNVVENLEVNAKMTLLKKVYFVVADTLYKSVEVPAESSVVLFELPQSDSLACTSWKNGEKIYNAESKVAVAEFDTLKAGCSVNTFSVKFVAFDTTIVDEKTVAYGMAAEAPAEDLIPNVKGYRFVEWIEDFSRITVDTKINANYVETVEICFITNDNPDCSDYDKGSEVSVPELLKDNPAEEGFTCTEWTKNGETFDGASFIALENTEFVAKCHDNFFNVKFIVLGEQNGETQRIAYGKAATAPSVNVPGYRFDGWDKAFDNVVENLEVVANMTPMVEICFNAPDYNVENCKEYEKNSTVNVEDLPGTDPSAEGFTCTEWTKNGEIFTGTQFVAVEKTVFEAKCHDNFFDVKFIVLGAQNGETQRIAYGKAATAPSVNVPGYRFDGWDKAFDNVVENLEVVANMTPMVEICFNAPDYNVENCKEYEKNSTVNVEDLPGTDPSTEGFTCTEWTKNGEIFTGTQFVAVEKTVFEAKCHDNFFDVKFIVLGKQNGETQRIAYGKAATAPSVNVPGYRLDGWDKAFDKVESDLVVNANMKKMEEFCVIALGEEDCKLVPVDSLLDLPENPRSEDSTCYDWLDKTGEIFNKAQFYVTEASMLKARCTADFLIVRFLVDDTVYASDKVARGYDAKAPEAPEKKDWRFDHWDKDFTNVQDNMDVNAVYVETVDYCIVAADIDTCKTVDKGSVNDTPDLPKSEEESGVTCTDWLVGGEIYSENTFVADSSIKFVGVCHNNAYDVKFLAFDTTLVDSQKVAYGAAAVSPDSLLQVYEGYRFNSWDKAFDNVVEDLVVNAVFDTMVKVSVKVPGYSLDTSFYVVKDTVIKDIKEILEIIPAFVCEDITVNGEAFNADTLVVNKDVAVAANCHAEKYTVSYYANEKLLGTEIVFHNLSAKKNVEVPQLANKRFVGWDIEDELKRVVKDLKANAVYEDVDTVFVMANGKAIDTLVIAKNDSVNYVLPSLENTKDSTFNGWKFNNKNTAAGKTVVVKGGMTIVADFSRTVGISGSYVVGFSVRSENNKLQVIGATIGDVMTVFDLQGRVVLNKRVQSAIETVEIARTGSFLVRVGYQTKKVTIK